MSEVLCPGARPKIPLHISMRVCLVQSRTLDLFDINLVRIQDLLTQKVHAVPDTANCKSINASCLIFNYYILLITAPHSTPFIYFV